LRQIQSREEEKHCITVITAVIFTGNRQKAYKQEGSQLFERVDNGRTRGNGFKLKEGRFRLDVGEILYYESGEVLNRLPERLWMPHPWRCSRPGWMGPWAAWAGMKWGGWWPCLQQRGWSFVILEVPSNPSHSVVCDSVRNYFCLLHLFRERIDVYRIHSLCQRL